jgi:hypothetical protein
VSNYEISYIARNGQRSLVCLTLCNNDLDARVAANAMMRPEFARVEIWCDTKHVASIARERLAQ